MNSIPRLAILIYLSMGINIATAGSWPQFRGPNASGHAAGKEKLPAAIGPNKNVVWKIALPPGHSSPIIVGNRVFLTTVKNKKLFTVGIDATNGKVLWQAEAPHDGLEKVHAVGSHAQPSPVSDGKLVISFFGSSGLYCYNLDGRLVWKRRMGPFSNTYGAACSPILVRNLIVLNQDHDIDSHLLAIDKNTGKTVWKADRGEFPRGYCTPIVWQNGDQTQIVVVGALRVAGYDAATGRELWTVRELARISNLTPVLGPDGILYVAEWAPGGDETNRIEADPWKVMAAQFDKDKNDALELNELPDGPLKARYPQIDRDKDGKITKAEYDWMQVIFNSAQNVLVAIKLGGSGDVTKTHVMWKHRKSLPYVPSPLYSNGSLLLIKSGGILTRVSAAGKMTSQQRLPKTGRYYSSPIQGDGKIYLLSERGGLTVLSAGDDWEVLSTADFSEFAYASPAIADGRIYVRTEKHLYCFGLEE